MKVGMDRSSVEARSGNMGLLDDREFADLLNLILYEKVRRETSRLNPKFNWKLQMELIAMGRTGPDDREIHSIDFKTKKIEEYFNIQ